MCGDGKIVGKEVCDDGNTKSGDGCSGDCRKKEKGWGCTGKEPTVCNAWGDGVLSRSTGEQCDDGNLRDLDGCSRDMKIE